MILFSSPCAWKEKTHVFTCDTQYPLSVFCLNLELLCLNAQNECTDESFATQPTLAKLSSQIFNSPWSVKRNLSCGMDATQSQTEGDWPTMMAKFASEANATHPRSCRIRACC
jgi:hypothetical protein